MKKNSNLRKAKVEKNDEFYTELSDIEKELGHYKKHFKNKVVFCNCDDPEWSNFWTFFALNFEFFGLKKLVATHYEFDKPSYKLEIVKDVNKDGKINKLDTIKTPLKQNGDFRSDESIAILKEADIVVTNPPFSLFREYIDLLVQHKKKFLVVGNMNAITYKETFKLIKESKIWLGINNVKNFIKPDGTLQSFGNINWFTNLEHKKRNEEIISYKTYKGNEKDYPKYDNYDAINVDKVVDIPSDYYGHIGVPITFLSKYNPNQFELLGIMNTGEENRGIRYENTPHGRPIINGIEKYLRILIKRK